MKKLQLLFVALMLTLSFEAKADDIINTSLNLNNPDVRKCLVESTQNEDWKLTTLYYNADKKLVMIFEKGNDTKTYVSK